MTIKSTASFAPEAVAARYQRSPDRLSSASSVQRTSLCASRLAASRDLRASLSLPSTRRWPFTRKLPS